MRVADAVDTHFRWQAEQVDKLEQSVQKVQEDAATNADTVQTLLVGIENLGDNFKQLREQVLQRGNPEQQMETDEDREYAETAAPLLQEVSLAFPNVLDSVPPIANVPSSVFVPDAVTDLTLSEPSSSTLSPNADINMQLR